jgi:O-antigen/teichoic acid export membrane protein
MSSYQRLFKSGTANATSLVVRIVQQLLLVTVLVSVWPTELYGEWLVVSAIPIFLSLADFGFVLAGSNELSRRATSENEKSVIDFYTIYSVYIQRWSLLIAFILGVFAFTLPLKAWMSLQVMAATEVSSIFLLLSLGALISQNSLTLFAGLRAKGKAHYGLWVRVFQAVVGSLIALTLVGVFEVSPIVLASSMLIVTIIFYLLEWWVLKKEGLTQSTHFLQKMNNDSGIQMMPYLSKGMEMMLIPLAQAITLQGSIILVGKTLGPIAVAIFVTHRTFARLSSSVVKVFANPLLAEAGLLQRPEDKPILTQIVSLLTRVTFWLALLMLAGFLIFGNWVYNLWVQGNIDFNEQLLVIFLIGIIAESLWQIVTAVRMGSNRHRPVAWGYLTFSILGLVTASLLATNYGILGIAVGVTLIDIAMMILAVWTLRGIVDTSIRQFIFGLAVPPIKEIKQVLKKITSKGTNNAN